MHVVFQKQEENHYTDIPGVLEVDQTSWMETTMESLCHENFSSDFRRLVLVPSG